ISSGTIIASVVKDSTLKSTAEYQLLLSAIALPGAFLGAFALPYFGSKYLLMTGFTGFIIIGLSIGLAWEKVTANVPAFVVLYGLLASFGNFGPGSVCGLVAAESYPTALRGTFYGLSAAIGKTGAAIGTQVFRPIQDNLGKKWTFIIAAIVGLVGVVIAYIFVPDTTQLDFEAEDEAWRAYLLSQGWNHEMGDGSGPEHLA
ncbi:Plasma membrane permease, mediates uptake of glycerophosphoinositol and glycerophosphocholine, partial [Tilletia horrida]